MTGPTLAGLPSKPFGGRDSAIATYIKGVPAIRSNMPGKPLEKMKLSPKSKRHTLHTK